MSVSIELFVVSSFVVVVVVVVVVLLLCSARPSKFTKTIGLLFYDNLIVVRRLGSTALVFFCCGCRCCLVIIAFSSIFLVKPTISTKDVSALIVIESTPIPIQTATRNLLVTRASVMIASPRRVSTSPRWIFEPQVSIEKSLGKRSRPGPACAVERDVVVAVSSKRERKERRRRRMRGEKRNAPSVLPGVFFRNG